MTPYLVLLDDTLDYKV